MLVIHKAKKPMPIIEVHKKKVVLPNYDYSDKYWPIISKLVFDEVGNTEIKEPNEVRETLKKCFSKLCEIFYEKIVNEKRASFYLFCHCLHEDSMELWLLQIKKIALGINEEDFAASRRILKIILEQSTTFDLKGAPNFYNEITENLEDFTNHLEELLYIGSWCIQLSEFTARSQLFPTSTGLKVTDGVLDILTYQPYPELFKFVHQDMQRHNSKVALSNSLDDFKDVIKDNYGVTYDNLCSFIHQQNVRPPYKVGLTKISPLIENIKSELNGNGQFIEDFYSGLTVKRENCLSIEKCFYNNQSEFRHTFRPILELVVDNEKYNIIGYHKWLESMTLLPTNSFPFGIYPSEWKNHKELKEFIKIVDNTHDKILEEPISKILEGKKFPNDNNVVSFSQPKGDNINISKTVGDIDILFLDIENKLIYVCECKHNRSRFDMNNWKRDYSNFKEKYETQLKRKVDWATDNKEVIATHFSDKYQKSFDLTEFEIRGTFIINAPTIYMYNGMYRAFTITDFENLIDRNYIDLKFEFTNETTGDKTLIEYPYFDNTKEKLG